MMLNHFKKGDFTLDSIASVIGLKDDEVEYCKEVIRKLNDCDIHTFYIRLVNHGGRCPHCGTFTKQTKEYKERTIKHAIFIQDKCIIKYSSRRLKYPKCNATFTEDNLFQKQYKALTDKTDTNFDRFRNRDLFILNKSSTYSYEKLENKVKKKRQQ